MFARCLFFLFTVISLQMDARPIRVYADIAGDMFHAGHVNFLKKARSFGDVMVVGVLSDEDIQSYKRIPIMTLEERVAVIEACRYVDEVIVAPPLRTTKEWLEEHQIDIVVHGDDFAPDIFMDQYGVPFELGIMRTVPYTPGISTSNIIERIKSRVLSQLP